MIATKEQLKKWFKEAEEKGSSYMITICDTFSFEDYPIFCEDREMAEKRVRAVGPTQRVLEVFDISLGWEAQSNGRVFNL